MKYCAFRLYAPLCSWGEIAAGGERRSALHPSKSAIIGLIGAAMGIEREDEEKQFTLASSVGFAVKLVNPGTVIRDFHTAQVPRTVKNVVYYTRKDEIEALDEKDNAIISYREYRCDSLSVVIVWINQNNKDISLDKIQQALITPTYHLYLGRKSCPPALPLQPQIIETATIKEAFNKVQFGPISPVCQQGIKQKRFENYEKGNFVQGNITYYWEECKNSGFDKYLHKTQRYDHPLSRTRWQFALRDEYMAIESVKET